MKLIALQQATGHLAPDLKGGWTLLGGRREGAGVMGGQHRVRDLPEVVGDHLS